jgi:hypothetical protein
MFALAQQGIDPVVQRQLTVQELDYCIAGVDKVIEENNKR